VILRQLGSLQVPCCVSVTVSVPPASVRWLEKPTWRKFAFVWSEADVSTTETDTLLPSAARDLAKTVYVFEGMTLPPLVEMLTET
jgi:hypothetical protein